MENVVTKKLYVGNLSFSIDDTSLAEVFAEFAPEEVNVVQDRETGRSRGFGFVTFSSEEDAQRALEMNGREVDGRTIAVSEAQEKRGPRSFGDRNGGGGGGRGGFSRRGDMNRNRY